ncbi:MAG: DUF1444 family protein [Polyangiaceae bacterium]|nr:DUF1444 family protein [Polyangiaceae bacterium]
MRRCWAIVVVTSFVACSRTAEPDGADTRARRSATASGTGAAGALRPASTVEAWPTGTDFAERVRAVVLRRQPALEVRVDGPLDLSWSVGGEPARMTLHNAWRYCTASPEACDATLDKLVDATLRAPPPESLAVEHLRPVLFGEATSASQATLATAAPPFRPVLRPFVADLQVGYAFDSADHMVHLQARHLERLGLDAEAVHARAVANLEHAAAPFEPFRVAPGQNIYGLSTRDSYDAPRLLLDARWAALAARHGGTLVAGVPTRDVVLFAPNATARDIDILRGAVALAYANQPNPISRTLLRWREHGWEVAR